MQDVTTQDEIDAKPSGLVCRKCGCRHFLVYMTRQKASYIQRVRVCRHCGQRLLTREKPA